MNVHRYLAAILLLFAWSAGHAATTQYYYDDLGRIVQAVRSDGAVFQYQYDANGNVLAINRISASSVSIAELHSASWAGGRDSHDFGHGIQRDAVAERSRVQRWGARYGHVGFADHP